MKKQFQHILVFVCVFVCVGSLPACSFLNENPASSIQDTQLEDNAETAAQWVTGVYSKWIYDMFCWGYFPKVLEFDADYITGPDWFFGKFGAGNFQGESDVTDALWNGCYSLIQRTNTAERHLAAMRNLTVDEKNNAIGEVRFQRAFAYFLLVRAYGALPIQNENGSLGESRERVAVDSVYRYITTTLESAVPMLYKNNDAAYQQGHVCAGSAAGLLAKVYATEAAAAMPVGTPVTVYGGPVYQYSEQGEKEYAPLKKIEVQKQAVAGYENLDAQALYRKAQYWAEQLLSGKYGQHSLLPYDDLWRKSSATASEFLFSVGSVSGDAKYKNSVHTQYEGYTAKEGSELIASGQWIGGTQHWYAMFEDEDERIVKGVKHRWRLTDDEKWNSGFYYPLTEEYTIRATGKNLKGEWVADPASPYDDGVGYRYSMSSQCLAFTTKYADVTNAATEYADANWPFLRLADVYLIYAEAMNELGDIDAARTYLNKVRTRSAATVDNGTLADKDAMRSAILTERAKELACEADRRWDLIRWGIYLPVMNSLEGSDDCGVSKVRTERHLLYPIPAAEINTNKFINTNNPGWN